METGLYSGAANLAALEGWQAVIASNLANASTPGFRKTEFVIEGEAAARGASGASLHGGDMMPFGESRRSFAPGEIRATGSPYDLAVQGRGMFSLRDHSGGTLYSKDGEFHRDADGFLVSKQGYSVLGLNGPIQIPADQGPFTISDNGIISQEGDVLDTLAIYEFEEPQQLTGSNGSLFRDPDGRAGANRQEDPRVLQGYLEGANISPLREMVSLIQVSRAYESTQKMMQARDEMNAKAIESLGSRP